MKKILILTIAAMITLLLIGCSRIDEYFSGQMLKKSTVLEESEYIAYEQYVSEGVLDNDGYYSEATDLVDEAHAPIHVTFADNSNLSIQYYLDAAHTTALNQSACYLNPGDSIHAVVAVNDDIFSSMYEFAGFTIFEIDENGGRKETSAVKIDFNTQDYILSIPPAYEGEELSVVPVGAYQKRKISLSAFAFDEDEKKSEANGKWYVNEKECSEKSVDISAISSYIISYQYDSDSYFFVSSEPECYYSSNIDGVVIFKQRDPADSTVDYTVNLHKYLNVTLVSDMDRRISIDNGPMDTYMANSEVPIPGLHYGQHVILTTNKEWTALENCRDLILTSSSRESENYKYELIVPEKGGEFLFDPSEYQYEHGTIIFTCFGNVVNSPQMLAKGSKIFYSEGSAENGYWLMPGDNHVIVGKEEETRQQLQDIHFTQKIPVTVSLEQPEYGGTVIYTVDGKRLYGNTYSTYSGTEIKMEFRPWPGWVLDDKALNGDVYRVNNNLSQIIKGPGYEIRSVFTEAQNHKPKLTVTLNESVCDMTFNVEASGFHSGKCTYSDGFLQQNDDVVDEQMIGTEVPITVTIGNRSLESNKALRFVMKKTDTEGNVITDTRYVTDLTARLDPFVIYAENDLGVSKTTYKSVNITISIVDIKAFYKPTAPSNATITVRNMLTNTVMIGGELIEGSQKVTVTIFPAAGYYITGDKVTGDVYQATMEYSDYLEDISEIINNHTAERYLTVTLDTSDPFAVYTYKLEGNVVSGTIKVKKGQELSLNYKIADSEHKLAEGAGGIPLVGWFASYSEVSKEIIINKIRTIHARSNATIYDTNVLYLNENRKRTRE